MMAKHSILCVVGHEWRPVLRPLTSGVVFDREKKKKKGVCRWPGVRIRTGLRATDVCTGAVCWLLARGTDSYWASSAGVCVGLWMRSRIIGGRIGVVAVAGNIGITRFGMLTRAVVGYM